MKLVTYQTKTSQEPLFGLVINAKTSKKCWCKSAAKRIYRARKRRA
ncbi:hypothetical protein SAMN04488689_105413 [Paenibacillus sp. cl6col]|nr:hypothetical protein SAMN04488689_105413 [Paenibacillus sp. cl6col]